ncbi:MAG: hypothetical protein ACRDTI_23255, partial [Mycobacterium sp.]
MPASPIPVGTVRRHAPLAVLVCAVVVACGGAGESVTRTVTQTVTDQTTITHEGDGGSHESTSGGGSSTSGKTPKDDGLA